jgi:hypothetical protein
MEKTETLLYTYMFRGMKYDGYRLFCLLQKKES